MAPFAVVFSTSGRISPKPFWIGALFVYLLSVLSQFLLAAPVTAQASVIPFVLGQGVVTWVWYALHAKRLRDAGRSVNPALVLTVLHVLGVSLLLLVFIAVTMHGAAASEQPSNRILDLFLISFLLGTIFGQPNLGLFGVVILFVIALVVVPILIAVAFTLWVGTRPSACETS
jgi:uncharacterized membrane protein YhaH (DUF805 family)